jgi:hypothetical protein
MYKNSQYKCYNMFQSCNLIYFVLFELETSISFVDFDRISFIEKKEITPHFYIL